MNELYRCPHSAECESKLKEDEFVCWQWHVQTIDYWINKGCPYNYNCDPLNCIIKIRGDEKPSKIDIKMAKACRRHVSKLKHKTQKEVKDVRKSN